MWKRRAPDPLNMLADGTGIGFPVAGGRLPRNANAIISMRRTGRFRNEDCFVVRACNDLPQGQPNVSGDHAEDDSCLKPDQGLDKVAKIHR